MTSDRKWTVDDVQQLVEAASSVLNDEHTKLRGSLWHELRTALAPFQPDPDAELVTQIQRIRSGDGIIQQDDTNRAIIAAVRDHDAKAVAK